MVNTNKLSIGDYVCFGKRLGEFGKKPLKVIGIEIRDNEYFIKTDYNNTFCNAELYENLDGTPLS